MSELKNAMKQNVPVIKAKKTPVKVRYTGPQPQDDYGALVNRHKESYKRAFEGNLDWQKYLKGN